MFLDSSLLIEWRKGTRTALLQEILEKPELAPCINHIVVSEYLFHHLALFGGKAPLTLKESVQIAPLLRENDPTPFLIYL